MEAPGRAPPSACPIRPVAHEPFPRAGALVEEAGIVLVADVDKPTLDSRSRNMRVYADFES